MLDEQKTKRTGVNKLKPTNSILIYLDEVKQQSMYFNPASNEKMNVYKKELYVKNFGNTTIFKLEQGKNIIHIGDMSPLGKDITLAKSDAFEITSKLEDFCNANGINIQKL